MAAFGLYTHIQSNRRRSIALLLGLFFLVYVMVFAGALVFEALVHDDWPIERILASAFGQLILAMPWATAGAALWMVIAYFFHQTLIDAVTGGHGVTRLEQPRLYNLLENLCISRGMPMPKLKIMESDALNAFASGLNERQYAITVTTGLVKHLDNAEIEAVLAHELTHIRNGDVRMLVIAVVIAGAIGFFAELVFRMLFHGGFRWFGAAARAGSGGGSSGGGGSSNRGKGGGALIAILIALALVALAWFLSVMIRFALSRRREFLADAGAVELTKNPDAMIMALRKIEGRGELDGVTSAVMEMCVDNPREGFADLFATHPTIESRVKALIDFAGGRDPGPLDLADPGDTVSGGGAQPEREPPRYVIPGAPPMPSGTPVAGPGPLPVPGPWGPRGER